MDQQVHDRDSLEQRPGIFMIGSPNVGKRTLLSRLLSVDFEDASDSSSDLLTYGWTINTKYYTVDVSVWMAHLHNEFSIRSLPIFDRLAALVMVFDMNDLSSLVALKDWVSRTDIQNSLLGEEEPSWEIKRSCLEWCSDHNIEFIEACASNADFDRCLSVDGDSQGVERLYRALSAHMWPRMILKSGNKISLPEKQELSEEESDYEIEYEVLSAASAEPWDDMDVGWVSANSSIATTAAGGSVDIDDRKNESKAVEGELQPSTSLMSEIGNMRDSLRLMPDFQRREMAANLALKMAAMFGDSSGDEEGCD
ncbi:hypothetical protein F0562_004040 [Nyssa sinensis]|uniref:Uncharacterized protein n=1 Tax=Nyssa sinensis TaxID=561372 RepID=A0A5J5C292_9ASTE|nr:hypothetical protein F0562_004040 [Nyssa sinensis]